MKKGLLIIFLIGIFVFSIGAVSAGADCSSDGYRNKAWDCDKCDSSVCSYVDEQCLSTNRNCQYSSGSKRYWDGTGVTCEKDYTCSDSWTSDYRCDPNNENDVQIKKNIKDCGSGWLQCIISETSWVYQSTCDYGCTEGVCDSCDNSCDQTIGAATTCGEQVVNQCGDNCADIGRFGAGDLPQSEQRGASNQWFVVLSCLDQHRCGSSGFEFTKVFGGEKSDEGPPVFQQFRQCRYRIFALQAEQLCSFFGNVPVVLFDGFHYKWDYLRVIEFTDSFDRL